MAMAQATEHAGGTFARGKGAVKRLRNAVQEALPVLQLLEAAEDLPDRIGTYAVRSGEPLDEDDVLEFLRLARSQHQGEMRIIVLGPPALMSRASGTPDYGPPPATS